MEFIEFIGFVYFVWFIGFIDLVEFIEFVEEISKIKMGDCNDFTNFMTAVIDQRAFDKINGYVDRARSDKDCEIIAGGANNQLSNEVICCDLPIPINLTCEPYPAPLRDSYTSLSCSNRAVHVPQV